MFSIHAIIISHNTCDLTLSCLKSLQEALSIYKYIITVVDNASSDGSVEKIKTLSPKVNIIENTRNKGFGGACNQALVSDGFKSDYYLFANSDTIANKNTIDEFVNGLKKNREWGAVTGQLIYPDGSKQNVVSNIPSLFNEIFPKGVGNILFPNQFPSKRTCHENKTFIKSFIGAFFMVRGSVLKKVNGFDPRYFFFLEETDLCLRISNLGYRLVYLPKSFITHHQGASASKNIKWSRFQFYRSKYQFFRKHYGPSKLFTLYSYNFVKLSFNTLIYFLLAFINKFRQKLIVSKSLWIHHFKGFSPLIIKNDFKKVNWSESEFYYSSPRTDIELPYLPEVCKTAWSEIKKSNIAGTYKLNLGRISVLLKQVSYSCLKSNLRFAKNNVYNSEKLLNIGIDTPSFIAFGQYKKANKNHGFFISEWVENCRELNYYDSFLKQQILSEIQQEETMVFENKKRELIRYLAKWVALLHSKQVFHKDLKASNIMIRKSKSYGRFCDFIVVDIEKISFGFFRGRLQIKNIVQLNKSFTDFDQVTVWDRLRFIHWYFKYSGYPISRQKKLLKRINAWTRKIWAKKKISPDITVL